MNAHPHLDCKSEIAIVHNGIIENYKLLKEKLMELGHHFVSDTDTEIIAHLIEQFLLSEPTLEDAVRSAMKRVEGTYGLVVMSLKNPDKLIAVRKKAALL